MTRGFLVLVYKLHILLYSLVLSCLLKNTGLVLLYTNKLVLGLRLELLITRQQTAHYPRYH